MKRYKQFLSLPSDLIEGKNYKPDEGIRRTELGTKTQFKVKAQIIQSSICVRLPSKEIYKLRSTSTRIFFSGLIKNHSILVGTLNRGR